MHRTKRTRRTKRAHRTKWTTTPRAIARVLPLGTSSAAFVLAEAAVSWWVAAGNPRVVDVCALAYARHMSSKLIHLDVFSMWLLSLLLLTLSRCSCNFEIF